MNDSNDTPDGATSGDGTGMTDWQEEADRICTLMLACSKDASVKHLSDESIVTIRDMGPERKTWTAKYWHFVVGELQMPGRFALHPEPMEDRYYTTRWASMEDHLLNGLILAYQAKARGEPEADAVPNPEQEADRNLT